MYREGFGNRKKLRIEETLLIRTRKAIVKKIIEEDYNISKIEVDIDGSIENAINYDSISGKVKIGDIVIVNTNAIHLNLGTGGYNFVIFNYSNETKDFSSSEGHIIKLRYTPLQVKCLTTDEQESPYHDIIKYKREIEGLKVFIGQLHSMLAPVVFLLKHYNKDLEIVYIMTDSACLPIAYSNIVRILKQRGLIQSTITCGQAFGGDFETVNLYTALITAKYVCNCDAVIVTPGPGVVGTSTALGFSGVEQGHVIDAVNTLNGYPVFIPRISFSDKRIRHKGISHHSITILNTIAYSKANIAIPLFEGYKHKYILKQIKENSLDSKHNIRFIKENSLCILKSEINNLETMGRNLEQDVDYFKTIGAAVSMEFS